MNLVDLIFSLLHYQYLLLKLEMKTINGHKTCEASLINYGRITFGRKVWKVPQSIN
jgi:hypothetical protein